MIDEIAKTDVLQRLSRSEIDSAKCEIVGIVDAEKAKRQGEVDFDTHFDFSLAEFVVRSRESIIEEAKSAEGFGAGVLELVRQKCEHGARECYKRAGIGRQTFSKIVTRKDNQVTKRIAMQICIGLRLSVNEAECLLSKAGYVFTRSSLEDMAFRWCLEHSVYNILDVNRILFSLKCSPLKLTF